MSIEPNLPEPCAAELMVYLDEAGTVPLDLTPTQMEAVLKALGFAMTDMDAFSVYDDDSLEECVIPALDAFE